MSDMQWEKRVMKKIRFMVNFIWSGINFSDVETFLSNFGNEKTVGLALLDMLIYYSYEQEQFIAENLFRLLKRDLWIKGELGEQNQPSGQLLDNLEKAYRNMCFIPVRDHDPGDSAYSLSSIYKKLDDWSPLIDFIDVTEIPLMLALQKKYFIFYDDIVGTGHQFTTFWEQTYYWGKHRVTLKTIAERNPDICFYYLAFSGYQKSIQCLSQKASNLKIITSEVFTCDYSIFDDGNEYWEFNPSKKDSVVPFVREKEKELGIKNKYGLNIPVLFEHSRAPNTTLSLYWYSKENAWKKLYGR